MDDDRLEQMHRENVALLSEILHQLERLNCAHLDMQLVDANGIYEHRCIRCNKLLHLYRQITYPKPAHEDG
jgi:hypothetical protein